MFDDGMIIVLAMRLLGPLIIFRWPLFGSLVSEFVFDALDIVIWAALGPTDINYTAYDKPLDIYQLTIMAIMASRWEHKTVRNTALFLYGYRLLGYGLYLATDLRVMFFFFPNIFFYFFVAYLAAKKIGLPELFEDKRQLAVMMGIIILAKLPQEYILHWPH
ncbi:conserved hypothetical protein [Nitrosococcus oceani ATCC 19707]|uniref:Transmembrane protein n=2 Tax=Nitrosococcus oceani TaxID=1229 RepID=Q3J8U4_NITOC|nr:hypothetical protein [Nitrosococcus oceani]ABA58752.1 conserved hypothetical protein [Nitrosococcus oceani ATCC 19707]EDZ67258.1 hypothetical protein NOC27_585 [Nitrosococcus oceani AFC27]KFI18832.1 hypothetical protein IB75_12265 [Nitrosococcus oceani C-27]GEM19156.1 hypothetical protein NONS58_05300 [Nitrosococcus oceani]